MSKTLQLPVHSYVAIGDSFSEGVGDEDQNGHCIGWPQRFARHLATAQQHSVQYANLAIRGKILSEIVAEQLPRALALQPDLVTIAGGGNDIMRLNRDYGGLAKMLVGAADQVTASGAFALIVSGADMRLVLPGGKTLGALGDKYQAVALTELGERAYVNNWGDVRIQQAEHWSADRLHMNARGHARVAQNLADWLQLDIPDRVAEISGNTQAQGKPGPRYYWEHALPWAWRRISGVSSGDQISPAFGGRYTTINPE